MKCIVNGDVVLSRPLEGPLSAHIAAFAAWAREQGYARRSRYRQVLLAACFSRWLGQHAVSVRRVCAEHPVQYLRWRARRMQVHRGDAAALRQFLEFLRHEGVIPAEKAATRRLTPVEQETQAFAASLRNERTPAEATIVNYVPFACRFLTGRFGNGAVALSRLCAGDVVRCVQRQALRLSRKRAKLLTTALRAFLHYARYRGEVAHDLAAAVPCVANWSMASIPRALSTDAVRQLLGSIDRRTAVGRRDYAIVLLLARLGLRAGEVVRLELDDLDWNAGSVRVRGKGGQPTALPLPAEVGAAIATYLEHGRPHSTSRRVFLRAKAPIRGFLDQRAIGSLVRLSGRLRPWTYHCLFGLLSVSGLRLGEARNLELQDVDLRAGVLTIRGTKFGKSRVVPLHASTCRVLAEYLARRQRHWARRPVSSYVFVSNWGNRLDGGEIHRTFYAISRQVGLRGPMDSHGPRLHDLWHRFAATTLLRWYRAGEDAERRWPSLSTYLGHVHLSDTFWYLSAWPELMHEAMARLERCWEDRS